MERKIGEVFTCNGELYRVVRGFSCKGCAFMKNHSCYSHSVNKLLGHCDYATRSDKTGVIFKEIKDMEIKNNQLTIDIPEGMEIDLENSDLAKGIVKFKEKELCFNDILNSLRKKPSYSTYDLEVSAYNAESLNALGQLMDIAKYYNGDWKPNWSDVNEYKYFIICDVNTYKVDYCWMYTYNNICFKNKKDAQAVIDNPNFRDILDAIYKN